MTISLMIKIAFAAMLLAAAYSDARRFLIPNIYPLLVILLFIAAWLVGFEFHAPLWKHLLHFAIALAAGMLLFRFRWFGGGDAKLYAAVALWFGIGDAIPLLFITTLAGAAIVVVRVILRLFGRGAAISKTSDRRIAYGVAIAIGGIAAMYHVYPLAPTPRPSLLAML